MPSLARRLLITALIVVLLLLAADRVGDYLAERTAADTLQSSQNLPTRPNVDIGGFPFLTQLAAGDFERVTITADDVPVGQGTSLDLSRLRLVLHDVTVSRDFSQVSAATAEATATVTYAELSRTLGARISYRDAGRVQARESVTVGGRTVTASVSARPRLVNGALRFTQVRADSLGAVGDDVAGALRRALDLEIPLHGIPFRVQVRTLRMEPGGLLVELTGRDLSYENG